MKERKVRVKSLDVDVVDFEVVLFFCFYCWIWIEWWLGFGYFMVMGEWLFVFKFRCV